MDAHFNRFELENFSQSAADAFLNRDGDLNEVITKQARDNGFTPDHIDRVVQNANIFVNAELVKKARADDQDPRISFPLANSAEIAGALKGDVHKLAELKKEAQVFELFSVKPTEKLAHDEVLDATVGKMAPDPYAEQSLSVSHMDLAKEMLKDASAADAVSERATALTLSHVCQTLEHLEHRSLTDHNLAKIAMEEVENDLRTEIHDQLLSSCSPATLRDVLKHANLDGRTAKYIDALVTKVASELQMREGKSAFADGALVNPRHSLIEKSAGVVEAVKESVRTHQGLDKFASAHKAARGHYAQAVREKR